MKKSKDEVYFAVCNTVLRMEIAKGHLKWTVSDISRFSGITRSLIYYYFDKDKEQILEESYKYMVNLFFSTNPSEAIGIRARMKKVLSDLQHMPYMFVHYFLEKNKDSKLGKIIKKGEEDLIDYLHRTNPEYSREDIFKIYLTELGAIAYQLPTDKVDGLFPDI